MLAFPRVWWCPYEEQNKYMLNFVLGFIGVSGVSVERKKRCVRSVAFGCL